jgi:uncharacterized protein YpuA (DUF1002 family)
MDENNERELRRMIDELRENAGAMGDFSRAFQEAEDEVRRARQESRRDHNETRKGFLSYLGSTWTKSRDQSKAANQKLNSLTDSVRMNFEALGKDVGDSLYQIRGHLERTTLLFGSGALIWGVMKYSNDLINVYEGLSSAGIRVEGGLLGMSSAAAASGLTLEEFARTARENSLVMARIPGGTEAFTRMTKSVRQVASEFGNYGFTVAGLNDLTGAYLETQRLQGHLGVMDTERARNQIINLAKNTSSLSIAMGKSRDELNKQSQDAQRIATFAAQQRMIGTEESGKQYNDMLAILASQPGEIGGMLSQFLGQTAGEISGQAAMTQVGQSFNQWAPGITTAMTMLNQQLLSTNSFEERIDLGNDFIERAQAEIKQNYAAILVAANRGDAAAQQMLDFYINAQKVDKAKAMQDNEIEQLTKVLLKSKTDIGIIMGDIRLFFLRRLVELVKVFEEFRTTEEFEGIKESFRIIGRAIGDVTKSLLVFVGALKPDDVLDFSSVIKTAFGGLAWIVGIVASVFAGFASVISELVKNGAISVFWLAISNLGKGLGTLLKTVSGFFGSVFGISSVQETEDGETELGFSRADIKPIQAGLDLFALMSGTLGGLTWMLEKAESGVKWFTSALVGLSKSRILNHLKDSLVGWWEATDGVWDGMTGLGESLMGQIRMIDGMWVSSDGIWKNVKRIGKTLFEQIKIFDGLWVSSDSIWTNVKRIGTSLLDHIGVFGRSLASSETLAEVYAGLTDTMNGIWESAKSLAGDLLAQLEVFAGEDYAPGLRRFKQGVTDLFDVLGGGDTGLGRVFRDFYRSVRTIVDQFMGTPVDIGREPDAAGMGEGDFNQNDGRASLSTTLASFAGAVQTLVADLWKAFGETDIGVKVTEFIDNVDTTISNVSRLMASITDLVGSISGLVPVIGKEGEEGGLFGTINSMITGLTGFVAALRALSEGDFAGFWDNTLVKFTAAIAGAFAAKNLVEMLLSKVSVGAFVNVYGRTVHVFGGGGPGGSAGPGGSTKGGFVKGAGWFAGLFKAMEQVPLAVANIGEIRRQEEEGHLTRSEANREEIAEVIHRGGIVAGTAAGAAAGAALGSVIPGFGNILGGFIGAGIGAYLGADAMDAIGQDVKNYIVGEISPTILADREYAESRNNLIKLERELEKLKDQEALMKMSSLSDAYLPPPPTDPALLESIRLLREAIRQQTADLAAVQARLTDDMQNSFSRNANATQGSMIFGGL